jgi:hypothetical protein
MNIILFNNETKMLQKITARTYIFGAVLFLYIQTNIHT